MDYSNVGNLKQCWMHSRALRAAPEQCSVPAYSIYGSTRRPSCHSNQMSSSFMWSHTSPFASVTRKWKSRKGAWTARVLAILLDNVAWEKCKKKLANLNTLLLEQQHPTSCPQERRIWRQSTGRPVEAVSQHWQPLTNKKTSSHSNLLVRAWNYVVV